MGLHAVRSFNESCVRSDRWLALVKLSERLMSAEWLFQRGFLVHFIDLEHGRSGAWEMRRDKGRLFVRTTSGCYMASAYCLHEEEELAQANAWAAAAWGKRFEGDQSLLWGWTGRSGGASDSQAANLCPDKTAWTIGRNEMIGCRGRDAEATLQDIAALTPESVAAAGRRLLLAGPPAVVVLGPRLNRRQRSAVEQLSAAWSP